ncbi:MAG: ABC transporter permease [Verrucomicrobiota bacterium]|jgi:microcin C transport system permease protein
MGAYFLRRLLLIPPTLIGVTMLVFLITRFVPGGPMERMIAEMRKGGEGGSRGGAAQNQALSEEQLDQLKVRFRMDQHPVAGYFSWLGVWPYADLRRRIEFGPDETEQTIRAPGTREPLRITKTPDGSFALTKPDGSPAAPWQWRTLPAKEGPQTITRIEVFRKRFSGLLTGNLGESFRFNEPVTDVIAQRLPVSLYYGLVTLFLTYLISIPLGLFKALKHRTLPDNLSSILIFAGFAIPGYALGSILVTFAAARFGWFPTGGFTSFDFMEKSLGGKIVDILHHSALPLVCYLIGAFAFTTMLTKNQLMDNLAADYVRTAVAKGVPYRRAVIHHAFRNASIPVVSNLGRSLSAFVGGSFVIERIFDINGIGLLGFESILDRDYPVVMGIVVISSLLVMLGNILGDFLVALVDPRIRFD